MNHPGLEGVVAAATGLSEVDGERGELIIGGFPLAELAEHASFEETMWLLWHGELPTARQLETFRDELAVAAGTRAGDRGAACAPARPRT